MTDAEVVRIARMIEKRRWEIYDLYTKLRDGDHPRAEEIEQVLADNQIPPLAWATHCVADCLEHPERWEIYQSIDAPHYGIRRKGKGTP